MNFLTDLVVDESFHFHHFYLTIHNCQYFITFAVNKALTYKLNVIV